MLEYLKQGGDSGRIVGGLTGYVAHVVTDVPYLARQKYIVKRLKLSSFSPCREFFLSGYNNTFAWQRSR